MIIRKEQAPVERRTEEDGQTYGARDSLHLSDAGGLTEFGAHVQTLEPGSCSSDRHWHEEEDEFLYVISGEATVVEEDDDHPLGPGDAACWPAGVANAHQGVRTTRGAVSRKRAPAPRAKMFVEVATERGARTYLLGGRHRCRIYTPSGSS